MFRLFYIFFLAISLQLNSTTVEGGAILTLDSASSFEATATASGAGPSHQQPQSDKSGIAFQFGSSFGMSGNASVNQVRPSILGLALECVGIDSSVQLCWRRAIENSVLPNPPVLDGLLKPA